MLNWYTVSSRNEVNLNTFTDRERLSLAYHNLFDYPMNLADLIKWLPLDKNGLYNQDFNIATKRGYCYIEGREGLIYKRILKKRISAKKIKIAKKASRVLSIIPSIKMVAVTGSLAMNNSANDSDIDLMIITKKESLWITRLFSYLAFSIYHLSFRRPFDHNQKDKLCLNMWLDESDLVWKKSDRNLYTSHEIAQIVPLVNKSNTYEKFLFQNKWILNFWPNSVKIERTAYRLQRTGKNLYAKTYTLLPVLLEKLAYKIQYWYMEKKITREEITPTRALFHPQDWGKVVLSRLLK